MHWIVIVQRLASTMYAELANDCITNSRVYCLINSVAFHPGQDLLCATFSTKSQLILYTVDATGRARVLQKIGGPGTGLANPQHAVFSADGRRIVAVNWSAENFTVYAQAAGGNYAAVPIATTSFPPQMAGYKPHGIDLCPHGELLAVAFGASTREPKALAMFRFEPESGALRLTHLTAPHALPGIPKGICFSPDGRQLLATFSDVNCIAIHAVDRPRGAIAATPSQVLQHPDTGLARPEDIKFSRDAAHVIVSNSGSDTVDFYRFDAAAGRIAQAAPVFTLRHRPSGIEFPHGLAVSPSGAHLVVSQFGHLPQTEDEDIVFSNRTPTRQAKIWIFGRDAAASDAKGPRRWTWTLWRQLRDRLERRT